MKFNINDLKNEELKIAQYLYETKIKDLSEFMHSEYKCMGPPNPPSSIELNLHLSKYAKELSAMYTLFQCMMILANEERREARRENEKTT